MTFNIGDKVRTKGILSPVNYGIIVGIETSELFNERMIRSNFELKNWDNTFPEWRTKLVYTIKKGLALPHLTEDVFNENIEKQWRLFWIEQSRHERYVVFVESELELYDWIEEVEKSLSEQL